METTIEVTVIINIVVVVVIVVICTCHDGDPTLFSATELERIITRGSLWKRCSAGVATGLAHQRHERD